MVGQPSPEARQDYNALLEVLLPFAEQTLKKYGAFFPFAAAVSTTGEVSLHAAYDGDDKPPSDELIAMLVQAFQGEARSAKIRAIGICYDGRGVRNGKKVAAIIISLEHLSGNASVTCLPYSKGLFGKYGFGEMTAAAEEPKIFVSANVNAS